MAPFKTLLDIHFLSPKKYDFLFSQSFIHIPYDILGKVSVVEGKHQCC